MIVAKKRFYAIKKGKGNIRNRIVETWSECSDLVLGYPSEYKGFATREEAEVYLGIKVKEVSFDETSKRSRTKNMRIKRRKSRNKNTTILDVEICKELYNEFYDRCSSLDIAENDIIVSLIKEWLL